MAAKKPLIIDSGKIQEVQPPNTLDLGGASFSSIILSNLITPPQITVNQDDYNPTGLSGASGLRLDSSNNREITGIEAQEGGRVLYVFNIGANDIKLKKNNIGSLAANRFLLKADVTIQSDEAVILVYDGVDLRWREIGI